MGYRVTAVRGIARSTVREVRCKDCLRERAAGAVHADAPADEAAEHFNYNEDWAQQVVERGGSRTDRCPRHRKLHRQAINGVAVAYVDIQTTGQAVGHADEHGPFGPLGGLGPLPSLHQAKSVPVDLSDFKFGMTDDHIREMLAKLEERRVLILKAGTGTGKSTFAPFRLLSPPDDVDFRLAELGPIIVTEPRVQATTGVATFVGERLVMGCPLMMCNDPQHGSFNPRAHLDDPVGATGPSCVAEDCQRPHVGKHPGPEGPDCVVSDCTRHIGPGFRVGYQVANDKNHDPACQLLYVTDGTMVNWITEGRLGAVGTVIVDEAHERSANIDFILAFLRREIDRYPNLRVIVTSATFDVGFYERYFGPSRVYTMTVPATKAFGYGAPLFASEGGRDSFDCSCEKEVPPGGGEPQLPHAEQFATYEDWRDAHWPETITRDDGSVERLREITDQLRGLRFPRDISRSAWKDEMASAVAEHVIRLVNHLDDRGIAGDVLAFLPTMGRIEAAFRQVEAAICGERADLFALIQSSPTEHKKAAIAARPPGAKRKIVIATNMAETSLTVRGVRFVIDAGLNAQSEWSVETATGDVKTKEHSQSGLRQRWGRVGRDAPGWVFPLYTKASFADLPENTRPGSTRENLESLIVKVKAAGIDDVDSFVWPAAFEPERLDEDAYEAAETFVKELRRAPQALTANGVLTPKGQLTTYGKEVGRFGAHGPSFAVAVICGDQLACAPEVLSALLLLDKADRQQGYSHVEYGNLFIGGSFRPEWTPAEWRYQRQRRLAALFAGCRDDLDRVLCLVSAWERADSDRLPWEDSPLRERFASDWWLNHKVLLGMAELRRDDLARLSPAMKEEVKRFVDARLGLRARAAISRGYAALLHDRTDGSKYCSPSEPATLKELDSRYRSDDLPAQLLVLGNRDRYLDQLIEYYPWAAATSDVDTISPTFDLLLAALKHLPPIDAADVSARLQSISVHYPVGRRIRIDKALPTDETVPIGSPSSVIIASPPEHERPATAASSSWDRIVAAAADSDTAWPTAAVPQPVEPEERWQVIELDVDDVDPSTGRGLGDEANDEGSVEGDVVVDMFDLRPGQKQSAGPPRALLRCMAAPKAADAPGWFEVDGYEVVGDDVALNLLPSSLTTSFHGDPAANRDLACGAEIVVTVGPILSLDGQRYRRFDRADGCGRFFVADGSGKKNPKLYQNPAGLRQGDQTLLDGLREGVRMLAEVVPGPAGSRTISLVRYLRAHLLAVTPDEYAEPQPAKLPGIINDVAVRREDLVGTRRGTHGQVLLARCDAAAGVTYYYNFPPDTRPGRPQLERGTNITALLNYVAARRDYSIENADEAQALVAAVTELGVAAGVDNQVLGRSGQPTNVVALRTERAMSPQQRDDLLAVRDDVAWRDTIWSLYQWSHLVRVRYLRQRSGQFAPHQVDLSPTLWTNRLSQIAVGSVVHAVIAAESPTDFMLDVGLGRTARLAKDDAWGRPQRRVGDAMLAYVTEVGAESAAELVECGTFEATFQVAPEWAVCAELAPAAVSRYLNGYMDVSGDAEISVRWQTEAETIAGLALADELFATRLWAINVGSRSEVESFERQLNTVRRRVRFLAIDDVRGWVWVAARCRQDVDVLATALAPPTEAGWLDLQTSSQEQAFAQEVASLRSVDPLHTIKRGVGEVVWTFVADNPAGAVAFLDEVLRRFPEAAGGLDTPQESPVIDVLTGQPIQSPASFPPLAVALLEAHALDRIIDCTAPGVTDFLVWPLAPVPATENVGKREASPLSAPDSLVDPSRGPSGSPKPDSLSRAQGRDAPHPPGRPGVKPGVGRALPPSGHTANREYSPAAGRTASTGSGSPVGQEPLAVDREAALDGDVSSPRRDQTLARPNMLAVLAIVVVLVAGAAAVRAVVERHANPVTVAAVAVGAAPSAIWSGAAGSRMISVEMGCNCTHAYSDASFTIVDAYTRMPLVGPTPIGSAADQQYSVASPDGARIFVANTYSGGPDLLGYIDVLTGASVMYETGVENPSGIAISPDGSRLYVAGSLGEIRIYTADLDRLEVVSVPAASPGLLGVTADGSRLIMVSGNTLQVVDLATRVSAERFAAVGEGTITALAQSVDGARVYASTAEFVYTLDAKTMAVLNLPINLRGVAALTLAPDGGSIYVLGSEVVTQLRAIDGTVIDSFELQHQRGMTGGALAVTPDGRYLWHADPFVRYLEVVDLRPAAS